MTSSLIHYSQKKTHRAQFQQLQNFEAVLILFLNSNSVFSMLFAEQSIFYTNIKCHFYHIHTLT